MRLQHGLGGLGLPGARDSRDGAAHDVEDALSPADRARASADEHQGTRFRHRRCGRVRGRGEAVYDARDLQEQRVCAVREHFKERLSRRRHGRGRRPRRACRADRAGRYGDICGKIRRLSQSGADRPRALHEHGQHHELDQEGEDRAGRGISVREQEDLPLQPRDCPENKNRQQHPRPQRLDDPEGFLRLPSRAGLQPLLQDAVPSCISQTHELDRRGEDRRCARGLHRILPGPGR